LKRKSGNNYAFIDLQNIHLGIQDNVFRTRGYHLIFKPVLEKKNSQVKGNVDAELVLHTLIEYDNYNKAVIVTSDGDFACLVEYLYDQGKLEVVMSPQSRRCSVLLKRAAKGRIVFMNDVVHRFGRRQKRKGTR
jgi:uncharacterized LabA/DUF88 family protein